ncbi:MAG: ribbon-helix-helix domain-containing protein [Sulfolobaceae archaeon]
MKRVISVRLKEDIVKKIDNLCKNKKFENRTEFLRRALEFYVDLHKDKIKRNL